MELLAVKNQSIEGYETEDILGRGFNSVAYKGRSEQDSSTTVVVKVSKIPAGFSSADIFTDSSALHHPNIIPTKKIGSLADGTVYSVRNYVEGETLEGMLGQKGLFEVREAMHYLAQLASAIDYIHAQRRIHGNIKPSNVVIDGRFRAMLFDFGSRTKSLLEAESEQLPVSAAHYRSPEQLRGEPIGPATDIFSLGVLGFELLTGSRPFPGRDYDSVVSNVLSSAPLTLDDVGSNLPKPLEACLAQALSKEPELRYATAGEFVRALSRVLGTFVDEFGLVGGYSSLQASNDLNRRVRAQTVMTTIRPSEMLNIPTPELKSEELESDEVEVKEDAAVPSSYTTNPSPDKAPSSPTFGAPVKTAAPNGMGMTQPSSGSQLRVVIFALLLGVVGAVGYKLFSKDSLTVSDLVTEESDSMSTESGDSPPSTQTNSVTAPPAVPPANTKILEGLASSSPATVREAIQEAANLGDLSLLPELAKLVDHPEYTVRVDLAKALSLPPFMDRDESFGVIAKLVNDNEYLVRGFAAKTLVSSKRPDAAPLIAQRLAEEKNAIVSKVLSGK